MILKAALIGGVIGVIIGIFSIGIVPGFVTGAVFAIAIRKWIFRTFWS